MPYKDYKAYNRWVRVKSWTLNVRFVSIFSGEHKGKNGETITGTINDEAMIQLKLERQKYSKKDVNNSSLTYSGRTNNVDVKINQATTTSAPGVKSVTTATSIGPGEYTASLSILPDEGEYRLNLNNISVPITVKWEMTTKDYIAPPTIYNRQYSFVLPQERNLFITRENIKTTVIRLADKDKHQLPSDVSSLTGSIDGVNISSIYILPFGELLGDLIPERVDWEIIPEQAPAETDLFLEPIKVKGFPDYDHWLPVPRLQDNPDEIYGMPAPLAVKAFLKPKSKDVPVLEDIIHFYLTDVSAHEGRCCNHPKGLYKKDDLCFAEDQQNYIVVDPKDSRHAYTNGSVTEAIIVVEATDCGASGKLMARCEDLQLEGEFKPTKKPFLAIPRDDNGTGIADAWLDANGVKGYAADWDKDHVNGQSNDGDGLMLYSDYRGFVMVENGRRIYKRLEPKKKKMFIVDEGGIFREDLWGMMTGIEAHRLDRTLINGIGDKNNYRIVDFNESNGSNHKYAILLETIDVLLDMDPPPGGTADDGQYGYTSTSCKSPKDATYCRIFRSRIKDRMIPDIINLINTALTDPSSKEAVNLGVCGIPALDVKNSLDRLTPQSIVLLEKKLTQFVALHEVGHACGLDDHTTVDPVTGKIETNSLFGDISCFMCYFNSRFDYFRIIVDQSIFENDTAIISCKNGFCKTDPYKCHSKLNVNDIR